MNKNKNDYKNKNKNDNKNDIDYDIKTLNQQTFFSLCPCRAPKVIKSR